MKQTKIGSYDSKKQFCSSFAEGYNAEATPILWPSLDSSTLALIRRIPLWARLHQEKHYAGRLVSAFANALSDSMLKEAITLQGYQEQRHYQIIESFIKAYGIPTPPLQETALPENLESAYIDLGFQESLDLLLGFGFYGLAVDAGALPEELLLHFDRLLNEEARHTVFFINWFAYHQTKLGKSWNELRGASPLWQQRSELLKLLMAFGKDDDEENILFLLFDRLHPERLTVERFLTTCLRENKRRMDHFNDAALQPQLAPTLVRFGRSVFQFWPHRKTNRAVISPG